MPRDGKPARRRLMEAALELFAENGFDGVTAAQIAARAGLTERTFFRHFTDKQEVLFDGQAILGSALADAILAASPYLSVIQTVRSAFASMTDIFEQNRSFSEPRQKIIANTPALREREIAKQAALAHMMAEALRQRDVEPRRADLAARIGLAVLSNAFASWFIAPGSSLAAHLDGAFAELRELSIEA